MVNYPMFNVTGVMIHQLALDLYECVGACWAVVAARASEKFVALCVFGKPPDLPSSLLRTAAVLSCEREGIIEAKDGVFEVHTSTPAIVCPTFVRGELAGALIFGPKSDQQNYPFEEKELVVEFASHISKLLTKDARASCR
jgi:hypothetical protein